MGALNGEFFTTGGISVGLSIFGLAIGIGVHGSYPISKSSYIGNIGDDFQYYQGGLVLGYKSKWKSIGYRLFTLLGIASVNNFNRYSLHFVIAPSFHLDWHMFKSFVISVGLNYRYIVGANTRPSLDLNSVRNALHGTISFGWVH